MAAILEAETADKLPSVHVRSHWRIKWEQWIANGRIMH